MLLLFVLLVLAIASARVPCAQWRVAEGDGDPRIVCVCNGTYCDDVEPLGEISAGTVVRYDTTRSGKRLDRSRLNFRDSEGVGDRAKIKIEPWRRRQIIHGFGGAFTDSATLVADGMSNTSRYLIWKSFFGQDGSQYIVARVPIGSSDFSTGNYSYDETSGDYDLNNFHLASFDWRNKIPAIQLAQELTGNGVKLIASPWTAPSWMKKNGQLQGGGELLDDDRVWKSWANYFLKFFHAYKFHGIDFWALTPQNEPSISSDWGFFYQAMYFTSGNMARFIKDFLGPAIRGDELTKNIDIQILDNNRNMIFYVHELLQDQDVMRYTNGIAFHWYADGDDAWQLVDVRYKYPDKYMMYTEACSGWDQPPDKRVFLGSWERGQKYVKDILDALNNWVAGWVDWNMILNKNGGPNWAGNTVDAAIIADSEKDEFYKQPTFYALAHFSKFVRPGAVYVESWREGDTPNFDHAVFVEGQKKIVVMHNADEWNTARLAVVDNENPGLAIEIDVDPLSFVTLVYRLP